MKSTELKFNVIELLNKAGLKLADSQLKPENLKGIKPTLKKIGTYLGLTETQTVIFIAIYMVNFDGFQFDLREVFEYLGMPKHTAPLYIRDINIMLDKGIVECDIRESKRSLFGGYSYSNVRINNKIMKCIFDNTKPDFESMLKKPDMYSFCAYVSDLIEKRRDGGINTDILFFAVAQAETQNPQLKPVECLVNSELNIEDRTMLYEMYDDVKRGHKATGLQTTYDDIYDNRTHCMRAIRSVMDETSALCTGDYIVNVGGTFTNEVQIHLSDMSIDIMFEEDAEIIKRRHQSRDMKAHTDIYDKKLFFEPGLKERINFFSKAIEPENFEAMQQRMTEKGLVKGLTAIFYGTPGTGKTESAYQIARQTGRDLYVVDASKTKSMWFGESEKVMRKLFESYRAQCKRSALTPILLFNEADAVLGARMENKKQSLDETVNAMKNILLEEMESFEGILIATTNLVNNMDKAFERRFMFKVEFTKPTAEALTQIWQSKMDWLQPDEIGSLVDRFAFSGGQIDNIVRKATLNEVLTGNRPTMSELVDYCTTENYSTKLGKRLGFN